VQWGGGGAWGASGGRRESPGKKTGKKVDAVNEIRQCGPDSRAAIALSHGEAPRRGRKREGIEPDGCGCAIGGWHFQESRRVKMPGWSKRTPGGTPEDFVRKRK